MVKGNINAILIFISSLLFPLPSHQKVSDTSSSSSSESDEDEEDKIEGVEDVKIANNNNNNNNKNNNNAASGDPRRRASNKNNKDYGKKLCEMIAPVSRRYQMEREYRKLELLCTFFAGASHRTHVVLRNGGALLWMLSMVVHFAFDVNEAVKVYISFNCIIEALRKGF